MAICEAKLWNNWKYYEQIVVVVHVTCFWPPETPVVKLICLHSLDPLHVAMFPFIHTFSLLLTFIALLSSAYFYISTLSLSWYMSCTTLTYVSFIHAVLSSAFSTSTKTQRSFIRPSLYFSINSLRASITFVILVLLLTDHRVTLKTLSHSFMVWFHSLCSHQYRHSSSLLDIYTPAPVCDVDQVPFTLNPFLKLLTSSLLILCTFWVTNFPPSILISLSSFFIYLLLRVLLPSSYHTCNLLLHFHLYSFFFSVRSEHPCPSLSLITLTCFTLFLAQSLPIHLSP